MIVLKWIIFLPFNFIDHMCSGLEFLNYWKEYEDSVEGVISRFTAAEKNRIWCSWTQRQVQITGKRTSCMQIKTLVVKSFVQMTKFLLISLKSTVHTIRETIRTACTRWMKWQSNITAIFKEYHTIKSSGNHSHWSCKRKQQEVTNTANWNRLNIFAKKEVH